MNNLQENFHTSSKYQKCLIEVCITVVEEVQERLEFLLEMKELGYEKQYRPIIEQQVADKVRQMKTIDPQRCQDLGTLNHLHLAQSKPQA
jgi:hypothetical protein